jgi:hypothetical protein
VASNLGQLDAFALMSIAPPERKPKIETEPDPKMLKEGLAEIITDFFNSIDPKRTKSGLARCG